MQVRLRHQLHNKTEIYNMSLQENKIKSDMFCVTGICCDFFPLYYLSLCVCLLGDKVMADAPLTCDLFRFLQLLCEGHNAGVYSHNCTINHQ